MKRQSGQAIALIALMITVLVGMVALAIDGGRAYALRRDLQSAVDASALAAADRLQQSGSYSSAEQAGTAMFGSNLRLYAAPACSPAYQSPGASPLTIRCTYTDGTVLTQVVSYLGPDGALFKMSGTRSLVLDFAGLLTGGTRPVMAGSATSGVNNLVNAPTIESLDPAGCGGVPGSSITVSGGGTLNVVGDVVTAGSIAVPAGSVSVAGDVFARCQGSIPSVSTTCYSSAAIPPCTYPDVAGTINQGYRPYDPNYSRPNVTGPSQGIPESGVTLFPGVYASDPAFGSSRCYFLAAGVYDWAGGYTNFGGFVSNELKPPDEPVVSNNTELAHQIWDTGGVNCAGSFQLSAPSGLAIRQGTWAVEVTAARTDTYSGVSYQRESAPSMCRTVVVGSGDVLQVTISNLPGATEYNVYAAPPNNGCAGPFGFAGTLFVTGSVHNDNTAGCPSFSGTGCSLGWETATFDATVLGAAFAPNASAAPGVLGAYPPSSETPPLRVNLPNQNPSRATPPAGDRANENQCSSVVGAAVICPGPITPGAVQFYIPPGGCLNATTGADNFLFGGYQYDWILVYEPGAGHAPANTCANVLGAAADSAWVGLVYMPAASLTVSKAATFRTEATGGLLADTVTFSGQLPEIIYSSNFAPVPPASRLTG